MFNKMKTKSNSNRVVGLLICAAVFCVCLIGVSFVVALLIEKGRINFNAMSFLAPGAAFVSSLIGNMVIPKKQTQNMMLSIGITTGLFLLIWLVIAMLIFDGISMGGFGNAIGILLGGVICWLFNAIKTEKPKYKKYRSR